ncbi:MAG: deoxynucleoside kinase, partial [Bacilli bacterium]
AISNHFGTEAFFEDIETPLLEKFYRDPEKFGFPLQVHFLNSRFRDIKRALSHPCNVLDRSIYEDHLFCRSNMELGRIDPELYALYVDLLENMLEELTFFPKKAPDLLVYLRADFDTCLERIKRRGRSMEIDNDTYNYFKYIHSRYDDFIYNEYKASPIITIDAEKYNIVDNPELVPEVMQLIETTLRENGVPL